MMSNKYEWYYFIYFQISINYSAKMSDFFNKPKKSKIKSDIGTSKALPKIVPWVEK